MAQKNGFIIEPVNLGFKLIKQISEKRDLDPRIVLKILKYNVITVKQLSVITNRKVPTINNLIRKNREFRGWGLNVINPFPDGEGKGPMYILLDKRCIEWIKTCLEIQ